MSMTPNQKRIAIYPVAMLALGGLVYGGFVYEADPDFMTLLGSATARIQSAAVLPDGSVDEQGRPLRQKMLQEAEEMIALAEGQIPDSAIVCESRAYLATVRGEHSAAAALYREAQDLKGCTDEMRDSLVMNQARTHMLAEDFSAAVECLSRHHGRFLSQNEIAATSLHAQALFGAERVNEARELAMAMAAGESQDGVASVTAGELLEAFGDTAEAEAAYRRGSDQDAFANYYLARLKVAAGEIDSAMELLDLAFRGARERTMDRLERDRKVWQACATDARFMRLKEPIGTATTPGR